MDAGEFVALWKAEKNAYLVQLQGEESAAAAQLRALNLSAEQQPKLWAALDTILSDMLYTVLLGLDGAGSLGGVQHTYAIHDEDGTLISDCGDIEAEAWDQFHGNGGSVAD